MARVLERRRVTRMTGATSKKPHAAVALWVGYPGKVGLHRTCHAYKSWLCSAIAPCSKFVFVLFCRPDVGDTCVGFCASSLGNAAVQVEMKLSANYGRGTSPLQTEVSTILWLCYVVFDGMHSLRCLFLVCGARLRHYADTCRSRIPVAQGKSSSNLLQAFNLQFS